MGSITFDTQELVRELKTAGMAQDQADAVVRTIVKSYAELVTRQDLQVELAPIHAELKLLKWMSTTNIALSVFLVGLVGKVLHLW